MSEHFIKQLEIAKTGKRGTPKEVEQRSLWCFLFQLKFNRGRASW